MKKRAFLFLPLILAIFLSADAHCQDLYYWNGSDSLSLTICSTYVSVKPTDPDFADWAILLGGALDSDTAFVPNYLANGFWSLPLEEQINHDSLLTALRPQTLSYCRMANLFSSSMVAPDSGSAQSCKSTRRQRR